MYKSQRAQDKAGGSKEYHKSEINSSISAVENIDELEEFVPQVLGSPNSFDSPSSEGSRLADKYDYLKELNREIYFNEERERFWRNSEQEVIILEYVESFRRQLTQLFPRRRPIFVSPFNEYGIRKFVCTSIRPSPQEALWDVEVISEFVADFLEYYPLQDASEYPPLLPSLLAICHLRCGDSLDMSTLLVSILCGAGYDAYVVCGIASRRTTLRDRRGDQATKFLEMSA